MPDKVRKVGDTMDKKEHNTPKARVKKTATPSVVVETAEGEVARPALETGQQQAVPVMEHPHTVTETHDGYTPQVAPPPGFFPASPYMQFPYGDFPHYGFPQFPQPMAGPTWRPDWDTWSAYTESAQSRSASAHPVSDDSDDEDKPGPEAESEAAVTATPAGRQKSNLDSLAEGKLARMLKESREKCAADDRMGSDIHDSLAEQIESYFMDMASVGQDLDKMATDYPRPGNVPHMVVPRVDQEVFSGMDAATKGTDAALKTLQKGVIAALAAMAPVGSLMIARGEADAQLDNLAGNALDAMKTLALVSNGLGTRRKEMIKAGMQGIYAKALPRASGGSPEWLFGGNVAETAKQCETAQRLSEKIMRGKAGGQRGGPSPYMGPLFPH